MRRPKEKDEPLGGPPGFDVHQFDPTGVPFGPLMLMLGALLLEGTMLLMLYGTYAETMNLMGDVYVCELPVLGGALCWLDDELTISHLLAMILAIFSIAVPLVIWKEIITHKIHDDPQRWLSKPTNRVKAMIAGVLLGLVILLEAVNLYTLIAQSGASGPFLSQDTSAFKDFLARNQGLGLFVAALMAVINVVVALMTVRAVHAFKTALKDRSVG